MSNITFENLRVLLQSLQPTAETVPSPRSQTLLAAVD